MKKSEAILRKYIKQELIKEGLKDEYKQFHTEVGQTETGWKNRISQLKEKENSINSVRSVKTAIGDILEYFTENSIEEALGSVKKSNVKKFQRALSVMENILEDTDGWLEENQ